MAKDYFVYIMTNVNNTVLYVGITSDLRRRVFEHKNKLIDGFTKRYNITKLVYYEIFDDVYQAIEREKQIKKYKRYKKDKLIIELNSRWEELAEELI